MTNPEFGAAQPDVFHQENAARDDSGLPVDLRSDLRVDEPPAPAEMAAESEQAESEQPEPEHPELEQPELEQRGDDVADWAWVEEWRAGGEPNPWGPGLALAGFTALLVGSAVYVLSSGLSYRPVIAVGVNVLVAAGLGPALWLSRALPVLRWIAGGAVIGLLAAWLAVFVFLGG